MSVRVTGTDAQAAAQLDAHEHRDGHGRFDVRQMDALCTCGHRLGDHMAVSPRPCERNEDASFGEFCPCEKFVRSRAKAKTNG